MTTIASASVRPGTDRTPTARVLVIAASAGVALGVVDLTLQLTLPYPFANLANSSAVWALCAFTLAVSLRTTPARGAAAGAVLLVVAVEAYYVAAVVLDRADWSSLTRPSAVLWAVFGVVAGVVFGVAGTWVRQQSPWRSAAGLAAVSAVFFAEAGVRLLPSSGSGIGDTGTVLLTSGLGVAVLLTAVARPAHLARAAVLVVPLSVLGVAAFSMATF